MAVYPNRPRPIPASPVNAGPRQTAYARETANRTPREAYFEPPPEEYAKYVPAKTPDSQRSGGRGANGVSFGRGFEDRRPPQKAAAKNAAPAAQKKTESKAGTPLVSAFITPETAAAGILLSEILGPPKGLAYFSRKRR